MDWTIRAQEIITSVDAKARAIAEGRGTWNDDIVTEMKVAVGFEMNDMDYDFLRKYTAWRRDHPLA